MAKLIVQLGLLADDQDVPRTAAQIAKMSTHHLLQDPVRQKSAIAVSGPGPSTSREPAKVTGKSGVSPSTGVKVRTEAQQARRTRKFRQLKEKRLARGLLTSQQSRLTKPPGPASNPDAASQPPTQPTPPEAMEVDLPATKGEIPEEQAQLRQASDSEQVSEDAWLAASSPSLEGLPEIELDKTFYTPVGSPHQ